MSTRSTLHFCAKENNLLLSFTGMLSLHGSLDILETYLPNNLLKDKKELKTNVHLINLESPSHKKPEKSMKLWYMSCKN